MTAILAILNLFFTDASSDTVLMMLGEAISEFTANKLGSSSYSWSKSDTSRRQLPSIVKSAAQDSTIKRNNLRTNRTLLAIDILLA